ncbi:hypothetical protein AMTR_s00076p00062690 [Amborella trichopoda]|uniref:Uncharacterized protein n=1 Tax=Amborella trichopoda TaxID=13333 RepID=W1PAE5_AMBTC|nr:hypothetical protein AMTR_s00076p00062690 [Amborella trichopoda]
MALAKPEGLRFISHHRLAIKSMSSINGDPCTHVEARHWPSSTCDSSVTVCGHSIPRVLPARTTSSLPSDPSFSERLPNFLPGESSPILRNHPKNPLSSIRCSPKMLKALLWARSLLTVKSSPLPAGVLSLVD